MRAGMLGRRLREAGHEVVWWSSRFDYAAKVQRKGPGYHDTEAGRVILLDGTSYSRNVSLARLRNHRQIAKHFTLLAAGQSRPDLIIASYPTIELAQAAVAYGRRQNVPVIIDVRDLWPDIFLDILPTWAHGGGRVALAPLYRAKRNVMRDATAIFAANEDFLKWALAAGERTRSGLDGVYQLAYERANYSRAAIERAEAGWVEFGLRKEHKIACFFGNLSTQILDLNTVFEAARYLKVECPTARIVLCGDNGQLERLRKLAVDLPVVLPGWVDGPQIQTLMARSVVGLLPYRNRWDFVGHMPNKPIEYLAGGLPVVSGLAGSLGELLVKERCGLVYEEGDPRALADALIRFFEKSGVSTNMSKNAVEVFETRFSADVVYNSYIEASKRIAIAMRQPDAGAAPE